MSSSPGSSQQLSFTEHGSGPPLLLVHGLTVTGEMFNPVIDHLATKHRVIVPDLRGHGRSRHLPPPYTAGQLATVYGAAGPTGHRLQRRARLLPRRCHRPTTGPGPPPRCDRLLLFGTYAFNMATPREKLEGHLLPVLVHPLGMQRMAQLVVSRGTMQLGNERAAWLAGLMADQDRTLIVSA